MKSYFPDVNVWIALTYRGHVHHPAAHRWLEDAGEVQLFFCRLTQLGFLRLLTNAKVMEHDVRTQREAWQTYDRWLEDDRVDFRAEPPQIEPVFRRLTHGAQPASNVWPDAYLVSVAKAAAAMVVTLDAGFRSLAGSDALVLSPGL
jgi:toxin-antitoxin system PIN domain toxin